MSNAEFFKEVVGRQRDLTGGHEAAHIIHPVFIAHKAAAHGIEAGGQVLPQARAPG